MSDATSLNSEASTIVPAVVPAPDEARPVGSLVLPLNAAPIEVDTIINDQQLQRLFSHTEATWTRLGESEPHWSVLSAERFKQDHLSAHRAEFDASGLGDVELLLAFLHRNEIAEDRIHRVLEFGCGVGRVTRHLSERFGYIEAYDISPSHLARAQDTLKLAGRSNVALMRLNTLADMNGPQDIDLIFSVIVLQHNPPPAALAILRALLKRLRSGGIGYFQLPTHAIGYEFKLDRYLNDDIKSDHIEMHYVPQRHIFQTIAEENCLVLEVREDDWVGHRDRELSNTFLISKR